MQLATPHWLLQGSCTSSFEVVSERLCFNGFISFLSSQIATSAWRSGQGFGMLRCKQQARIWPMCRVLQAWKESLMINNNYHRVDAQSQYYLQNRNSLQHLLTWNTGVGFVKNQIFRICFFSLLGSEDLKFIYLLDLMWLLVFHVISWQCGHLTYWGIRCSYIGVPGVWRG